MKEFVEKLKKRAKRFLIDAKSDFESGEYDIALFHLEQAVQLSLKAKILSFGVEFPKTHEIRKLIEIVKELGIKEVEKVMKDKERIIELLELAYISSRYLPISFSEKDVKEAFKLAEELYKILWKE